MRWATRGKIKEEARDEGICKIVLTIDREVGPIFDFKKHFCLIDFKSFLIDFKLISIFNSFLGVSCFSIFLQRPVKFPSNCEMYIS
jgi:hypothetical protein